MLSYCNSVKIVMEGGSFIDLETLTDIPNAETIQAIHKTEILLNTPNAKNIIHLMSYSKNLKYKNIP